MEFMWRARWNSAKVLFFANRYLVFVDLTVFMAGSFYISVFWFMQLGVELCQVTIMFHYPHVGPPSSEDLSTASDFIYFFIREKRACTAYKPLRVRRGQLLPERCFH